MRNLEPLQQILPVPVLRVDGLHYCRYFSQSWLWFELELIYAGTLYMMCRTVLVCD